MAWSFAQLCHIWQNLHQSSSRSSAWAPRISATCTTLTSSLMPACGCSKSGETQSASRNWAWQISDYTRRRACIGWPRYLASSGSKTLCLSARSRISTLRLIPLGFKSARLLYKSITHRTRQLRPLPQTPITEVISILPWRRTCLQTLIQSYSTVST